MSAPIHFYLTFNPYLNHDYEHDYTQAHEFFDLLKDLKSKDKNETAYWGKIIGKDRDSKLNFDDFQKVFDLNKEEGISTHLFISDFQNLWVGRVKSIKRDIPKKGNMLNFYEGKNVEIWFELDDFFLLEHSHEETANKLSEFYIENEFSELEIHGLSPFTTSVYYPCFIQDLAEEQFFDEYDDSEYSHLVLRPNPAITKSSSELVLRSLYTYVFPEDMYAKIPHGAKLEIEACEMDMLESRHHNMQQMAFSYLKALEIVVNDLVIHHIKRMGLSDQFFVDTASAPAKLYMHHEKDHYIPLKQFNKNFGILYVLNFVEKANKQSNLPFKKAFAKHKQFIKYLTGEFANIVRDNNLVSIRNALAHGEAQKLSFKDANAIRSMIIGGAVPGLIHMCYRYFYKEKFDEHFGITEFEDSGKPKKKADLKLVS